MSEKTTLTMTKIKNIIIVSILTYILYLMFLNLKDPLFVFTYGCFWLLIFFIFFYTEDDEV